MSWSDAQRLCVEAQRTDEGKRAALSVNTFFRCVTADGTLLIELDSEEHLLSVGVLDGEVSIAGVGVLQIGQSFSSVARQAEGFELIAVIDEGGTLMLRSAGIRLVFEVRSSNLLRLPRPEMLEEIGDWPLHEVVVHGYGTNY